MNRANLELLIRDLNDYSAQLLERIATNKQAIHDAEVELVRIEAALNEYYEQLEAEL